MSKPAADNLSREKVQQLLAAVGSVPRQQTRAEAEAVDYDWRKPQYFSVAQRATLAGFVKNAAAACVDEFSRLYHGDVTVSVVSAEQYFQEAPDDETSPTEYCFAFGVDAQKPFGVVRIPAASAALWTGHILGGDDSTEEAGRTLSTLEESFLLDIASGLIKDFSRAYGSPLQVDRTLLRDVSAAALQGSKEVFQIVLEVQKTESAGGVAQASLLMCCDKLHAAAGRTASDEGKTAAADTIKAMRQHIQDIPVSLTVQLAKTMLRFEDIVELQANDIVLLGKRTSDPIDVLIDGRTLFQGRPAQSGGKCAVVIV